MISKAANLAHGWMVAANSYKNYPNASTCSASCVQYDDTSLIVACITYLVDTGGFL